MTESAARQAVEEFLEAEKIVTAAANQPNAFFMRFQGHSGAWDSFIDVRDDDDQLLVFSVVPERAPDDVRPAVAEYLTRANYGLPVGNFEMDYADGEIRYKTSFDHDGTVLTSKTVGQLVRYNVSTFERYLPGVRMVIAGMATPTDAISAVE